MRALILGLLLAGCATSKPAPPRADLGRSMEAFIKALDDPATVDGAFDRWAYDELDREGMGVLKGAKLTSMRSWPGYTCFTTEGQDAQGALASFRVCWVAESGRIADIDKR